nr:hypothetical protein Iba_chr12bCG15720 [Ipomoea batatas]
MINLHLLERMKNQAVKLPHKLRSEQFSNNSRGEQGTSTREPERFELSPTQCGDEGIILKSESDDSSSSGGNKEAPTNDNEQDDDLYHRCSSKPMDHFSNHGQIKDDTKTIMEDVRAVGTSLGELHEKGKIREGSEKSEGKGKKVKTTITLSGDVVPYVPYEDAVRKGFVEIENLPVWAKRWDSKIPGDILGSRNKINDILKKVQEKAKQKQEYHGLKLKN